MTQHGSFPDRPRGRRARPEDEVPELAGYDAVPRQEREFPDLSPARPRGGRGRHGRGGQQPQAQQALRKPASAPGWDDEQDENDPMAAFSQRWYRRGLDTPQDRRKSRRLFVIGGGVAAVAIAVAVYFITAGSGGPANVGIGSLVTTFLPGELQHVPDACTIVPNAMLDQYLPGKQKMAAPPLNSGASSQCTWTLDSPPTYRVLEVYLTAYSPSGLASGDGSATFAAEDAYAEDEAAKQHPGARSGQPKAAITAIPSLGSSAFGSTQVFSEGGAITDMATVYVRYRNVIITVVVNGLDKGNGTTRYGPVSQSAMLSAARAVAQQVTGKIVS